MTIFEWAVIGFITLSILFHVWRGGSRNPVSTGALDGKVGGLSNKLITIDGRVEAVEKKLVKLESEAATTTDIGRLETLVDERIATVRAEMHGHHELSQRTNHSVERIERFLIEKGLSGK